MPLQIVPAESTTEAGSTPGRNHNWLATALCAVAVVYALLAGLRTVTDYDLGWQMATGRWIVEHHRIPSTDVFSYTAAGQPWTYPVLSCLLFYALFTVGGYSLLSWLGADACVATAALLVRRDHPVTAALVVLVMPIIAARTTPRADMFTVVLFSAVLSILLRHFQSGRARLWLLPILMILWVNLHLGFIAGLALLGSYVALELLEMLFAGDRRREASRRLRRSAPWIAATIPATFVNPWGWNIYFALIRQNRAMAEHAQWITEWGRRPWNWQAISSHLSLQDSFGSLIFLLMVSGAAVLITIVRRDWGIALLLAGAAYFAVQHRRFEALFACVAVAAASMAIGGAREVLKRFLPDARMRQILAGGAVALVVILAAVRSFNVVSNRYYLGSSELGNFGSGLGWWCPERAAAFLEREHLPAQIFNNYNTGGFLVWSLGERYKDYLDGRAIPFGPEIFERQMRLMQDDPDGPLWGREADRNGINTILISLARYDGDIPALPKFCASQSWKPVYLDETSAIFLRSTPANQALIQKLGLDCSSIAFPPVRRGLTRAQAFHYWANSATVLFALRRNREAWAASSQALALFAGNAQVHFIRGAILNASGNLADAEREYQTALALEPNEVIWSSLAAIYRRQGREAEAKRAMLNSLALSARPHQRLIEMAFADILQKQPREALDALEEAERRAPKDAASSRQFQSDVLRARAAALNLLGDSSQAIVLQQKAVQLMPESADMWRDLADLYELTGHHREAIEARDQAARLDSRDH